MKTRLETERLILRPWRESDAETLYEYARDPRVGPAAGWPAHKSPEDSREIIKTVLSAGGTYAVTLKGDDRAIGSASIQDTMAPGYEGEREIGYWIGVPFWGLGLIPEAVAALLETAFADPGAERVWCGHFEGNVKSKRVIEKSGFRYAFDLVREVPLMGETRREFFYSIAKEDWENGKLSDPGGLRGG